MTARTHSEQSDAKAGPQQGEPIARIPRGNRELRIEWGSYKDHQFVDCRLWVKIGDDFRPSRAGITIPPNQVDDVIAALERAKASAPGTR